MPWAMTIMAALSMIAFAAIFYSFGVFFKPMANEFDFSRSAVSITVLIRAMTSAVLVLPAGALTDKYGPRWIVVPALLLYGTSFVLTGRIDSLWQLYLVQGLLMGIATAGPWMATITTVGKWHTKKAGLAMGITAVGAALGSVIFPSLSSLLIEAMGWRDAWAVLGIIVVSLGVPTALFLRNPGGRRKEPEVRSAQGGRTDLLSAWRLFLSYIRQPIFQSITIMFLLFYFSAALIQSHFVNYATDMRIAAVVAAAMASVMGLSSLAGRLTMGALSDIFGVRSSLAICFAVTIMGLALMAWGASMAMIWVAVALYGLGQGGEIPLVPAVVAEHYGKERLSTISGMVAVFTMASTAFGAYSGGAIFDWTGGYFWAFVIMIAMVATSLVMALRLGTASVTLRRQEQSS